MTRSAGYSVPDRVDTVRAPSSLCVKAATPSPRRRGRRAAEEVRDEVAVLRVQWGEDLLSELDDSDVEPASGEVLGHLKADEPAADDDGVPPWSHGLEAGVLLHTGKEAGAALDPLTDLAGVGNGAHLEDPGKVDARDRRMDGRSAG